MAKEKELKAQNVASLTAIYLGALMLMGLVEWGTEGLSAFTNELKDQLGSAVAISAFGGALSHFLPNKIKDFLLFFRVRDTLPGHRCRHLCAGDPRLSGQSLRERWPELFAKEMPNSIQNSYWYEKIYLPVRNTPQVRQSHRAFLLYRDATGGLFAIAFLGLFAKIVSQFIELPAMGTWSLVVVLLIALFFAQSGRQSGNRMVRNAVAVSLENDV